MEATDKEKARLEKILDDMAKGKSDGIAEFESLLDEYPDSLEVMGHLAWALANGGRHEDALEIYRRYQNLAPDNYEITWRMGDRLVNLGRLEDALEHYEKVLSLHPDCPDARMGKRYVEYLARKYGKNVIPPHIPKKPEPNEIQSRNQEIFEGEYRKGKIRLECLPMKVNLASTLKCNFRCQSCAKGYAPYFAEDLQEEVLEKVDRQLMPSCQVVNLTGFGEPTLASNFDRMLEVSGKHNAAVEFVSNGSLLNFPRLESLTRRRVSIAISLDGSTRETFEAIRPGGNFEAILDKLAMIKKLRDIHLSEFYSRFEINFLALIDNIPELPEVVRMASRFGFNCINVLDYIPQGTAYDRKSLVYHPEEGNRWLAEGERAAGELGIRMIRPADYSETPPPSPKSSPLDKLRRVRRLFPEKNRFPQKCKSAWSETYIHTDGTVCACCVSLYPLGNLKKKSFRKIWNGWRYRLFRWRLNSPIPHLDCRRCQIWWGINASNPANIMAREGLFLKVFYFGERAVYALGRRLEKIHNKLRGIRPPEPNYEGGRPIKKQPSSP